LTFLKIVQAWFVSGEAQPRPVQSVSCHATRTDTCDIGFASSAVVGLLWAAVSPTVAFLYAAGWMAASVLGAGLTRPAR
jgi:hypothetical protein